MRSFLLISSFVIGLSLLSAHIPEAAAATSAKIGKSQAARKAGRSVARKKTAGNPGDVWKRIQSGMKIPLSASSPAYSKKRDGSAEQRSAPLPAEGNRRPIAAVPARRYTELGLAKLAQRKYTPLGQKLLGAKAESSDIRCAPPNAAGTADGNLRRTQSRLDLPKMNGKPEPASGSRLQSAGLGKTGGTTARPNRSRPLTGHSTPAAPNSRIRAKLSVASPAALKPCTGPQWAAAGAKRSAHSSGQRNSLAEQSNARSPAADRIHSHITAYSQKSDFLNRVAERARPYLYHIVDELGKHRMPMELALLPIVESAYLPTAESPKSAKGLWQFIPSTGSDYHLIQKPDYDERLDVTKSTRAAIRFLSGLNHHYNGDWLLALAAYNSGQATVDNAISQNRALGLADDFWSLALPEETQNYVPRLLALASIFARPADYGIKLRAIKNEPYFVKIKIDSEFDVNYLAEMKIGSLARLANLDPDQFSRLNPAYLGPTLARRNSYTFLMPAANASQLRRSLASVARFLSEPVRPAKSMVLREKSKPYMDRREPSWSLVNELVFRAPFAVSKFAAPFVSLNLDGESGVANRTARPLA
ncbi:MAG: transglycosylase SLT domain-containing protein [Gammaproteobacteria bacterium]